MHTILLSTKTTGQETVIALECTCGVVFAKGLFVVDDEINRQFIRDEGWPDALAHERRVSIFK